TMERFNCAEIPPPSPYVQCCIPEIEFLSCGDFSLPVTEFTHVNPPPQYIIDWYTDVANEFWWNTCTWVNGDYAITRDNAGISSSPSRLILWSEGRPLDDFGSIPIVGDCRPTGGVCDPTGCWQFWDNCDYGWVSNPNASSSSS